MELRRYQKKVINALREYLNLLEEYSPSNAYRRLWESKDVIVAPIGANTMPPYRDTITGVPHVCMRRRIS
jgi:hypothetical protein